MVLAAAANLTLPMGTGSAQAVSGAPVVQSMVVGNAGQIISSARSVSAGAASVKVGSRSCAVAQGTPLAVLLALQSAGGPKVSLHDYGHCASNPLDSSELFVEELAGEANRGQDGWEYKVGQRSGSTGAADTSGAFGNGRLLTSAQRVLWFWCVSQGGGCQRTLEVTASATTVKAGASLTFTVSGYENSGRGSAIAAATVSDGLAVRGISSAAGGSVKVTMPSKPGSYQFTASKPGLVPSFPLTITVT